MSQFSLNLKSYCKKNKVKQPKEPYMIKSYALQKMRLEIIDFIRDNIDTGGGNITVKIPMNDTDGRLFSENGHYYYADNLGKYELTDLSTGFLGEQLYYSIKKESKGWGHEMYERIFDEIEGLEEEWMHCIISNKEKRIVLNTGVPLQFSGDGYAPGKMVPGTITAVYENEGEHFVCVDGREDIYWFDLNIDTKVLLCDELFNEFIPQVAPKTIEEALMLIALEDKSKFDRSTLASGEKTPVSVLTILCEDKNENVRDSLARNRSATPEILSKLAEDSDVNVREAVAKNPNTPADCLAKLAEGQEIVIDFGRKRDLCVYIRLAVAKNPNTPVESLIKLAEDPLQPIREAAISNPNFPSCSPKAEAYIDDDDELDSTQMNQEMDSSVPVIPVDELVQMAYDSDDHMREKAAENPDTPADCLVKLSKDHMWNVVKKVAKNPSTPLEVLMAYANTADKFIALAVDNPNFPLSKLLELAGISCFYPKVYPTEAIIHSLLERIDLK